MTRPANPGATVPYGLSQLSSAASTCRDRTAIEPIEPAVHACAAYRRQSQYLDFRVYQPRIFHTLPDIKLDMRQQVYFSQHHEVGGCEYVRILEWFVFAFGYGKDHDLVCLPQIEFGRADEVADIFDEQKRAIRDIYTLERVSHHVGFQVAARASVDLDRRRSGGANTLCVVTGLLVALDDGDWQPAFKLLYASYQQGGLA